MTRALPSLPHKLSGDSSVSWPWVVEHIVFGNIFLLKRKLQPDTLISITCLCHSCVYEVVSLHWLSIMLSELYCSRINFISKKVLEVLQNIPSILLHLICNKSKYNLVCCYATFVQTFWNSSDFFGSPHPVWSLELVTACTGRSIQFWKNRQLPCSI